MTEHLAVGLIGVFMLPAGVYAAVAPRSFFTSFPLGRSWVANQGDLYNEHLVRDVGGLFVALVIVTLWTAWGRRPVGAVAVAWLIQGLFHLSFHLAHLDGYDSIDRVGLLGTLIVVPALAVVALWAGRRSAAAGGPS